MVGVRPSDIYKCRREDVTEYCRRHGLRVVGFRAPRLGDMFLDSSFGPGWPHYPSPVTSPENWDEAWKLSFNGAPRLIVAKYPHPQNVPNVPNFPVSA